MTTPLRVPSPAKVNWTLFVLGKRDDGFHDIRSLVTPVTFGDELTFRTRPDATIELSCDDANLPTDGHNLIIQAAALLREESGCQVGVTCSLTKRIPVAGGLGGGSSNAATTLAALHRLWDLGWPRQRLAGLAQRLGSDVPLFLHGGSAVIAGRGERITPVQLGWRGWIVLLLPGIRISTASVYRAWGRAASPPDIPDVQALAAAAAATSEAVAWMRQTCNMLEPPVLELYPQMGDLMARAARVVDRPVRVSGSGSTLFTAFDTWVEASLAAREISERLGIRTELAQPVEHAVAAALEDG